MRKRVRFSYWCIATSAIATALLVGMMFFIPVKTGVWIVAAALAFLLLSALFYMPLSIAVNDDGLRVNRPLRSKTIPLADIASTELCPPTMAEMRLCGSGGWFGYYGWFREPSIGKYFAYYGKASDCFLVILNDGRKYMLGCQDPEEVVSLINKLIRNR